jgi:large conductance mechanosensitive channel
MTGFRKFLLRGNVVDLAVAVVIGTAFGAVVQALVSSFITPLIGAFGGTPDFSEVGFTVNGSRFAVGHFINALISFLIIAAVVYWFVVVPMNRLMERYQPQERVGTPMRDCPQCLSRIPQAARRCSFCTQEVPPVEPAKATGRRPA